MGRRYRIYGIVIESNRSIAGALEAPSGVPHQTRVVFGSLPDVAHGEDGWVVRYATPRADADPNLVFARHAEAGCYRFRYRDGTCFVLSSDGTRLWASWPPALTLADTVVYLQGAVLGFLRRVLGGTCLHASAVAVDGQAVGLLGPEGAGKSTLAGAFVKQHWPALTDDVLALEGERNGQLLVQPGYPRLRLWPDPAVAGTRELPRLTPNWDKRYLELEPHLFAADPMPLGLLVVLSARRDRWSLRRVSPRRALMALVANSHGNYLLSAQQRQAEFEVLAGIARATPAHAAHAAAGYRDLDAFCEAIVARVGGAGDGDRARRA